MLCCFLSIRGTYSSLRMGYLWKLKLEQTLLVFFTMSRQSLLPPRCPFQKPVVSRPIHDSYPQHHRSPSQGSILGEKPAWLDDLLSDEDADSRGTCLRRSASDSVTLLEGIVDSFSGSSPYNNEAASGGGETCSGLESASMYGPNSPRRRGNVTFSENAIASALSEYAFQNPLQYVDGSLCIWGNTPLDSMGNACGVGDSDRGCTDSCSSEGKAHWDTIFNVVRQNRLHPRERVIVLEIEKGLQYIHVEEEDYIHSTQLINSSLLHLQLLQWQQGCCHCSSLSLHSLTHSRFHSSHFASHIMPLFIGISWQLLHLFCCQTWLQG